MQRKKQKIGWSFSKRTDGGFDGFNDSGIETFQGDRYASLAREVLQNSLDAKCPNAKKVSLEFKLINIDKKVLPGYEQLDKILKNCLSEAKEGGDEKAGAFFKKALKKLQQKEIPCLVISDYNTTGLRGENNDRKSQWYAITKMAGSTVKQQEDAGGSYGIGKNATFVVSDLRTVFYYTFYKDEQGKPVEKAQGKAILMSHKDGNKTNKDGNKTNYNHANGYYGITDGCLPLEGRNNIPGIIPKRNKTGTTILIPAFSYESTWADEIASVVLSNFFFAIYSGKLEVRIVSHEEEDFCMDKGTLDDSLEQLLTRRNIDELKNAQAYLRAIKKDPNSKYAKYKDTEDNLLRHCELFVIQEEGLSKKVGIVRGTGMLITDEMKGLKRFSDMADFMAIFHCPAEKGNKLLRRMENPQHDTFEPDRLLSNKSEGEKALRIISDWVREKLKLLVGKPETDDITPINELALLIPNEDDDTLPGENFEGDVKIYPRPPKPNTKPIGRNGEGDDENGSDGSGNGNSDGGGGGRVSDGSGKNKTILPISNFRILKASGKTNKITFTPKFDGDAILGIYIAGDSQIETINIEKITQGGKELKKRQSRFEIKACNSGTKITLEITFNEAIFYPLMIELTE